MIIKGNKFKYFLDNESTTYEKILNSKHENPTVTVDGFNIHYHTPKTKGNKVEKVLEQVNEIQRQNGGRLDLDSLIYTFELRNQLPKDFSTVAADVNKEVDLWEQMSEAHQIPFDTENWLKGMSQAEFGLNKKGVKESANKLNYELDWEFIQQMAERMATNKGKYPPNNWKLPMDIDKLKQSLLRHTLEIIKGEDADDNRAQGHYESVALNAMMICYQLRNNL